MNSLFENDITWCANQDCKEIKCFRHQSHIKHPESRTQLLSFADFIGTEICKESILTD